MHLDTSQQYNPKKQADFSLGKQSAAGEAGGNPHPSQGKCLSCPCELSIILQKALGLCVERIHE